MLDTSTIRIEDVGAGRTNGWLTVWIDALRKHIEVSELSAAEAAGELNCEFRTAFTRNAVISQCHRSKITMASGRGGRKGPKGGPSTAKKRVKTGRPIAVKSEPAPPRKPLEPYAPACDPLAPGTVALVDLAPDGCRWPSGDGPFLFCDCPQFPGLPYCADHATLAYRVDQRRG